MKSLFTLLTVLAFVNAKAQITNTGFETWMDGNPAGWVTSNDSLPGSVVESDSAHTGIGALQINTVPFKNDSTKLGGGYVNTGNKGGGAPDASLPGKLFGWYRLLSDSGDLASVDVSAYYNSNLVGTGNTQLNPQDTAYKQFEVDITYGGSFATIDYSNVAIQLIKASVTDSLHKGTKLLIDDLSYGNTSTGVQSLTENNAGITNIYPNPSAGLSEIVYFIPTNANITLALYDILGRQQKVMINGRQAAGLYKVKLNTGGLSPGAYVVRLLVNNQPYNAPLVIN